MQVARKICVGSEPATFRSNKKHLQLMLLESILLEVLEGVLLQEAYCKAQGQKTRSFLDGCWWKLRRLSRDSSYEALDLQPDAFQEPALLLREAHREAQGQEPCSFPDNLRWELKQFRLDSCYEAHDLQPDNSQEPTIRKVDFPSWLSKMIVAATSLIVSKNVFWNLCPEDQKTIDRNFDESQGWAFLIKA